MRAYLKPLAIVSILNLLSNSLGAFVAIRRNLLANFGGFLGGQDVVRDFLGFNGTALSAPLAFLILEAVFILLAARGERRGGMVGVVGLTIMGAFYTIAQLGEPIVLQMLRPATFDPAQALVLTANVVSAALMLVFGALEWRRRRRLRRRSTDAERAREHADGR
jgi:hypothetical protein